MMEVTHLPSGSALALGQLLSGASEGILFIADPRFAFELQDFTLRRMAEVLHREEAGLVYADSVKRPRIDYQIGSLRDDFDFGPICAISVPRAREALQLYGEFDPKLRWGAMYDLRLKLSADHPIIRVPEPLYGTIDHDTRATSEQLFDYLEPAGIEYQEEMEAIVTDHLRRIGAFLPARQGRTRPSQERFPVEASVIIPVRNREATIGDAISSALSQRADFGFNVIVVDNHSTDNTGQVITSYDDPRLVRIVPKTHNLGIGGCWDQAVRSQMCGRFALQLDSDDLFLHPQVLSQVVQDMRVNGYAMLAASYTTVDFNLKEVPPGLVAHTEWSTENGHNNLLRVNGIGAPRAYDVSVIRQFGFPNVSYGEDYAMGLRVSREFEIGRIYESVYLCRRWGGNTDSDVSLEVSNARNSYKDWLRSGEIHARIKMRSKVGS
jgi:hypothetical protein